MMMNPEAFTPERFTEFLRTLSGLPEAEFNRVLELIDMKRLPIATLEMLNKRGLTNITIDEQAVRAEIERRLARGEPFSPDMIPGMKIKRQVEGQSVDEN